ncbi:hypothetical protein VTL71DRAFT_14655 [Oculimacula yallundae]|uniref:Uncharacterized protein n=1 Tax=Oculimacula yallundae TaxID=86028 RepID=A0ABR4CJ23_9HELO
MFPKATIISALVGLAVAAPASQTKSGLISSYEFQGIAIKSGDVTIQSHLIEASAGNLNINNGTTTACPASDCSASTDESDKTVFIYDIATKQVSLATSGTGFQIVFVRPDGSLGFSEAHSGGSRDARTGEPLEGYVSPFDFAPPYSGDTNGHLTFEGKPFLACPTGDEKRSYVIHTEAVNYSEEKNHGSNCQPIGFYTNEYSGKTAFQYD